MRPATTIAVAILIGMILVATMVQFVFLAR